MSLGVSSHIHQPACMIRHKQRDVEKPVVKTDVFQGEADPDRWIKLIGKEGEAFPTDALSRFDFHGNNGILILYQEINFCLVA